MRIAVLGATGMLGKAVTKAVEKAGYEAMPFSKTRCDITSPYNITRVLSSADAAINCAGIIPLRGKSPIEALEVNSVAPWILAKNFPGHIVQVSTDCVFSGIQRNKPYDVYDLPDGNTVYARSKLAGEVSADNVTVVRTSFIGFEHGLLDWLLDSRCSSVDGYEGVMWSGSTVFAVADELVKIAASNPSTLQHIALAAPISKYYLLRLLNDALDLDIRLTKVYFPIINRGLEPTICLPPIEESIYALREYLRYNDVLQSKRLPTRKLCDAELRRTYS